MRDTTEVIPRRRSTGALDEGVERELGREERLHLRTLDPEDVGWTERIEEVRPAVAEGVLHDVGVARSRDLRDRVQAADVEHELERRAELGWARNIGEDEVRALGMLIAGSLTREGDGLRREVDADRLPAVTREIRDVRPRAAAEIERAAGRRLRDELDELRRREAGVPAGAAEAVAEVEADPSEEPL